MVGAPGGEKVRFRSGEPGLRFFVIRQKTEYVDGDRFTMAGVGI